MAHDELIKDILKIMPSHGSHREPFNYKDHLLDPLAYSLPKLNCSCYERISEAGPKYTEEDFLKDEEMEQWFKEIVTRKVDINFTKKECNLGQAFQELYPEYEKFKEKNIEELEKILKTILIN